MSQTTERKVKQESQSTDDKDTDMDCDAVLVRTMIKEDIKIQVAFEMWTWTRMEKISRMKHITNGEVLEIVGEERNLIGT